MVVKVRVRVGGGCGGEEGGVEGPSGFGLNLVECQCC